MVLSCLLISSTQWKQLCSFSSPLCSATLQTVFTVPFIEPRFSTQYRYVSLVTSHFDHIHPSFSRKSLTIFLGIVLSIFDQMIDNLGLLGVKSEACEYLS